MEMARGGELRTPIMGSPSQEGCPLALWIGPAWPVLLHSHDYTILLIIRLNYSLVTDEAT